MRSSPLPKPPATQVRPGDSGSEIVATHCRPQAFAVVEIGVAVAVVWIAAVVVVVWLLWLLWFLWLLWLLWSFRLLRLLLLLLLWLSLM